MKTIKSKLFLSILFIFVFINCDNNTNEITNANEFNAFLQDEMESQHAPALAALIFKENNILYENYFGKTDIVQDIDLHADHLFLLASISKVITATALLQLYDDGLFDLDDKINDYLSFQILHPNFNTSITFRMLLTHTSSIADGSALDGQYYYGEDSPVNLAYFVKNYFDPDNGIYYNASENFHNEEPGTKYEYSNMGTALMGVLVEEISGVDFNTFCKQNIFTPLQMNSTAWRLDEINHTIVQPYIYLNGQYEGTGHYTFTDYPNGGLRSTAGDLFKFLSTIATGGTFDNYELLTSQTINKMKTPQITSLNNTMGLHLFKMDETNNLWGHDGGEQGVATIMAYNPTTKVGAIILTNQGDVDLDEILVEAYKLGLLL
jgi:CubicO group peptidase (beta-lactamase class C family)